MKVRHCIEIEFEEIIDDSKIKGGGNPDEIAAAAHCYKEQVEALCSAIEADGLRKCTVVYGLKKPFSISDVLRGIADEIENNSEKEEEKECV